MDKYENLGLVGEGSYGMVMKCRNKENGRIVAIKKFLESDDDKMVKKIAMREIKLLKQLRHENLVNLLEVCKKKRRWYLVFEFVDRTLLDDLEQFPNGLDYNKVKKYLFQILRAITFCHHHSIIHRDIKPENILISQYGVVKLCDFGFARTMAAPGEVYTDYVATRWYRAPELLVGDTKYGKAVDVWAVGCLIVEMLTGEPLFPGDSDIDQVYHVMRCFGNLTPRHQELFYKNPTFAGVRLPEIKEMEPLERHFPKQSSVVLDLKCLQIDPDNRLSCSELLQHEYFNKDGFAERFTQELNTKIQKGLKENTSVPKKSKMTKRDKEDSLVEDKKLRSQDSNADIKNKDNKPNVKIKSKELTAEAEKVDRSASTNGNEILDKTTESRASLSKAVPPSLKDVNGNHDRPKSPAGTLIPPISHYPLAITTSCMNLNAGSGTVPGPHSFRWLVKPNDGSEVDRANEKMKKHMPLFKKQSQQPMSSHYNVSLAARFPNERSGIHEWSIHTDRMGNAIKKKWEFCKSDVHLPELNSNHLPELKGVEGKNSKILKKENRRVPESRIPSLAAMDLHSSVPSQQISGSSFHEHTDANFPRVEY
ncbi:cyclin-dependent kinase-like 2 isoform X2 [Polyodon spathula]|uniref:cyclin-dependent kinase-like 2 isoform X2 n=1 Tax=Polyodon spathula TaxID=7913 RepID=UPI001B7E318B|nr:cyclin-dependent kinase-like 2 isoform X2 [Polyodon spathula]